MPLCTGLHLCAASAPPLRRLCAASAASALRRRGDAYPNPEPNPNPNQAWRSPPKMAALSSSCLPASGCSSRSRSSRWRSPTSEAVSCLGPWSLVLGPWSLVLLLYTVAASQLVVAGDVRTPCGCLAVWPRGGCHLSYWCCCLESLFPRAHARVAAARRAFRVVCAHVSPDIGFFHMTPTGGRAGRPRAAPRSDLLFSIPRKAHPHCILQFAPEDKTECMSCGVGWVS